jgi:hypothetical protein
MMLPSVADAYGHAPAGRIELGAHFGMGRWLLIHISMQAASTPRKSVAAAFVHAPRQDRTNAV